jgi:hypothetical protein
MEKAIPLSQMGGIARIGFFALYLTQRCDSVGRAEHAAFKKKMTRMDVYDCIICSDPCIQ